MEHYAGIDVSLELSSVCVVDAQGKIVRETKVASEPEALVAFFASLGFAVKRIGLEAGPLSPFAHFPHLYNFEQFRSLGAGTLRVQNCIGRIPGTLGP